MVKAKKSANSKFSRVLKAFNPSSTRGKLLTFILTFAIFGGGYMVYRSFAAFDPGNLAKHPYVNLPSNLSSGQVACVNTAFRTAYGTIVYNCIYSPQNSSGAYDGTHYVGNYIVEKKEFQKTGQSVTNSSFDARDQLFKCGNMDNYFAGQGYYTGYGWIFYGYIYSWYGSSIAKPAFYSAGNKKCTPSGDWQKAYLWKK